MEQKEKTDPGIDPRAYAKFPLWDSCMPEERVVWGLKLSEKVAAKVAKARGLRDVEELESALLTHLTLALREPSICAWGLLYNRLRCKALNEADKMCTVTEHEKNNFFTSDSDSDRDM